MSIGKWLELKGFDVKPNATARPPAGQSAAAASVAAANAAAALALANDAKRETKGVKKEKEEDKGPPTPFEPWLDVLKEDFKPIQVGGSHDAHGFA